jgi:PAS domain S-box-containing protein
MTPVRSTEPDLQAKPRWRWFFLVAIALLLISGGLAIQQYVRFSAASDRIDRTYQVLSAIDELQARMLDVETGVREFLLTGDESYLAPSNEAEPHLTAAAAELTTLVVSDARQRARAQQLVGLVQQRMRELQSGVEAFKDGRRSESLSQISAGAGKLMMEAIRNSAAAMKAAESALLTERATEAVQARRISLAFAIASLMLAGTLGLVAVAVDRAFERRRAAFEREMARRLLAESSMLSATQELMRSERINRSILDNSGDCIQILEPDGRLVSMNRAGLRLMEVENFETYKARAWADLWPQTDGQAQTALIDAVKTGEGRFQGLGPTATPKWWDVIVTPLRDDGGHVTRLLAIARDISEQRRGEEERNSLLESEREARSEAERATQMKDEFLATLSHELRTPLNSIVGWVGVLRQDKSPETLEKAVDVIDRNSRRQAQMIDDLLDVSRIVSGKLPLDVQRVNMMSVIEEAVTSAQPAAEAKSVSLTTAFDGPADVYGDPVRLQQVVWNLVTNAIKFTGRDGTVRVGLHNVNGHTHIEVSDSGQGIAPDLLPHVFERFQQGDSSSTRRHGGLGLGLAIVKNLTEMHGGAVMASSEGVGRGAVFTVVLPLAAAISSRHTEPADAPVRSGALLADVLVMVVDDEPDARDLVQRLLEDAGARVSACDTAQCALQTIESGIVPDVIVSDVAMPEQDGYDFMKRVRQMERPMSAIPAAALTALARVADRRRALLAGFQTHLTKPVDPAELVATVASLAGRTGKSYV